MGGRPIRRVDFLWGDVIRRVVVKGFNASQGAELAVWADRERGQSILTHRKLAPGAGLTVSRTRRLELAIF